MITLNIKPGHKSVKAYYEAISSLSELGVSHEGAVSPAFASLLRHCANQFNQTLIEKYPLKTSNHGHTLFIDGALVDSFNLVHGFWEAKDTSDDLDKEIKRKFDVGYPKNNILFQAPNRIVIWQDGQEVFEYRLGNRAALDWVIDQYQVSTDKRSGIVDDPNRLDDPQYIIRLVGKVITVSLNTVNIVGSLPGTIFS